MTTPPEFVLIGGRPSIDLCNTRIGERELLDSPAALARWFVAARLTGREPGVGDRDLAAARVLRDGLRVALLSADAVAVAALADDWLAGVMGRLCVEPQTLRTRFDPGAGTPGCLMVDAVLDAVEIVREMPGRVRECADAGCPVVFLDTSRNGSRRWCSMERCGARAKASTYYRRHRA